MLRQMRNKLNHISSWLYTFFIFHCRLLSNLQTFYVGPSLLFAGFNVPYFETNWLYSLYHALVILQSGFLIEAFFVSTFSSQLPFANTNFISASHEISRHIFCASFLLYEMEETFIQSLNSFILSTLENCT